MKIPRQSPLKQIRRFCVSCCGGSTKSVRFCHDVDCSLWFYRFGRRALTVVRERGKKYEQLFDKSNFEKGGKFCPNKDEADYVL